MTVYQERRLMTAAADKVVIGRRYWYDRGPNRKRYGLSGGWGEVETLRRDGIGIRVRDCTDGDEYLADPRGMRATKPAKG